MDLSIIIVNWNSKEYLRQAIASVLAQTSGVEFEIIVVDAGSFDGCDKLLREHYPEVRFIQCEDNVGFARANNLGFKASRGRHILFLNPDTELRGPLVQTLLRHLRGLRNAGVVGCKLLNADGSTQTSCIQSIPTLLNQTLDWDFLRSRWPNSALWGTAPLNSSSPEPKPVEAIIGACMLIRRDVFQEVGLFSEDYFMYAEDIDLCYKLRKAGYTNYYVSETTLVHYGGGSSKAAVSDFAAVMMRESIWNFMRKSRGAVYGFAYRVLMLTSALVRLAVLLALRVVTPGRDRLSRLGASISKWRAILWWSVERDECIKRFQPGEPVKAPSSLAPG